MTHSQLSFDFDAIVAPEPSSAIKRRASYEAKVGQVGDAAWIAREVEVRDYWRVGMVTSLPLSSEIDGAESRYTQMLPGVVESISGDLAAVRIYAAPEYGYTLENYPLHLALAINVPLRDLGRYGLNQGLQSVVEAGTLSSGDESIAARIRARKNSAYEREIGMEAA